MEVKVITDVSVEPVTLTEIKNFCRIDADYAAEDDVLLLTAGAAREKLEKQLNLSFAEKTLMLQFDGFPIDIPYGPIREIESLISSTDTEDPPIEVEYTADGLDFKCLYVNAVNQCVIIYPVGYGSTSSAYNLTYTVGYETLPKALKQALLLQIDFDIKNQGMAMDDISPLALEKAEPYSKNLTIQ